MSTMTDEEPVKEPEKIEETDKKPNDTSTNDTSTNDTSTNDTSTLRLDQITSQIQQITEQINMNIATLRDELSKNMDSKISVIVDSKLSTIPVTLKALLDNYIVREEYEQLTKIILDTKNRIDTMKIEFNQTNEHITEITKIFERLKSIKPEDIAAGFSDEIQNIYHSLEKMEEESGYDISLNLARVPPEVLVQVYQIILDDIIKNLIFQLGQYEAERYIKQCLTDLKYHSCGSELFHFDGHKINLDEIKNTLSMNLISPKQINETYMQLITKLYEIIPGYKPKNFRGLIKVYTLQYAIDRVISLGNEINEFRAEFRKLRELVTRLEKVEKEIPQKIENIEKNINIKIEKQLNELAFLKELNKKVEKLESDLNRKLSGLTMDISAIHKEIEILKTDHNKVVEEIYIIKKKAESKAVPEDKSVLLPGKVEIGDTAEEDEKRKKELETLEQLGLNKNEIFVYMALDDNLRTLQYVKEISGGMFSETQLEKVMNMLEEKNLVEKKLKPDGVYYQKKPVEKEVTDYLFELTIQIYSILTLEGLTFDEIRTQIPKKIKNKEINEAINVLKVQKMIEERISEDGKKIRYLKVEK